MKINPNAPPTTPPGSTGVPPGQNAKETTDFESIMQDTGQEQESESETADSTRKARTSAPGQSPQIEKHTVPAQNRRAFVSFGVQEFQGSPQEEIAQEPGEETAMIKDPVPPEKAGVAQNAGIDENLSAKPSKDFRDALNQQTNPPSEIPQSVVATSKLLPEIKTPETQGLEEGSLSAEVMKQKLPQGTEAQSPKILKNVLREHEVKPEQLGSQALPISAYLEPPAHPKEIQTAGQPLLQIAEIEKIVENVFVGVNASGDPEFKLDMNLRELGAVNVKVTRTGEGLVIHFNTETEKAGLQLGQNLQTLQAALAQKGLAVYNLQLSIQNQPIPLNEFVEAIRPVPDSRVSRRDASARTERGRKDRTVPPPKGR